MVVVFDIDGVIADNAHRLRFMRKRDYDSFYSRNEIMKDTPIEDGIIPAGVPVLLLSKSVDSDDIRTSSTEEKGTAKGGQLKAAPKGGKEVKSIGNIYLVYDNAAKGLDAQMLNNGLTNVWDNVIAVEESPLTGGMFMPTPLTGVNENGYLMLSYRLLTDFYGYQVVNSISPEGYAMGGVSLTGDIDGDAGSAAMGVKEDRAFVAWEYAYSSSENRMNVNVMDENCFYTWEGDNTYSVTLETNDTWGYTPVKVIPVSAGWVVLYGNCTSWNGANFMVAMIDEAGEVVWTKQICEDDFKSSGFAVTYDERNAYIFYTQDEEYDDNWEVIPGSGGMYVMCVDIAGQSTAINEVETDNKAVKVEIYTVDGRRVNQLQDGVNIIRTTDANGNVTTKKVFN